MKASLAPSAAMFSLACRRSRLWSALAVRYSKRFGPVTGAHTSGVYNPDWPERVRSTMRALAFGVSEASDKGFSLRPKGVHLKTIRTLYHEIAIAEGCGYYGPPNLTG